MELILISDTKLKIMLSEKDMSKYSLNVKELDYDNTETRRAFWNILDEAKHKTGFDAARERIYIQVFPSMGGGCEIFVTRLDEAKDSEAVLEVKTHKSAREIYTFDEINSLLSVCERLQKNGYSGESSVYADNKHYYLTLSPLPKKSGEVSKYAFINDYALMRENKNYIYHILEDAREICAERAVDILAPLC